MKKLGNWKQIKISSKVFLTVQEYVIIKKNEKIVIR